MMTRMMALVGEVVMTMTTRRRTMVVPRHGSQQFHCQGQSLHRPSHQPDDALWIEHRY